MNLMAHLQSIAPPHVEVFVLEKGQSLDAVEIPPRFLVRTFHGKKCRTKAALLGEFARVLTFPDYFGKNWDAFEECLTDLLWLPAPGYLFLITEAEEVLADEADEYPTFISILKEAGIVWATEQDVRPAIPFHVFLVVGERLMKRRKDWLVPIVNPPAGPAPRTRPAGGSKRPSVRRR